MIIKALPNYNILLYELDNTDDGPHRSLKFHLDLVHSYTDDELGYLYEWFLKLDDIQLLKLSIRKSPNVNDNYIATGNFNSSIPDGGYVLMRRETAVDPNGNEFYVYTRYSRDDYWVLND